ncbi:MAG TPA: 4Fe-4S binding protein [Clostridiales bacterium]|nr:4Fe-4S binding protein [Clostridiales bacterium]
MNSNKVLSFLSNWSWVLIIVFLTLGWFYPIIGLVAIICMLGPVVVAFFRGRLWCGNICPRGGILDRFFKGMSGNNRIPKIFKNIYFRLAVIALLMGNFAMGVSKAWPDAAAVGRVFVIIIGITTLVAIVLSLFLSRRSWCSFCPMGTMAQGAAMFSQYLKRQYHREGCTGCSLCNKACPMGLDPVKDYRTHRDCILCADCVSACIKDVLSDA